MQQLSGNVWGMGKLKRFITEEGIREFATGALHSWLWPPFAAGLAIVMGSLDNVSWFYISIGASLMFASMATGLLRFSEWRFRQDPKDKLNFVGPLFGKVINNDGILESIYLGFSLHNSATFPIEFELKSIQTELDEKFPLKRPHLSEALSYRRTVGGQFYDHAIIVAPPFKKTSSKR